MTVTLRHDIPIKTTYTTVPRKFPVHYTDQAQEMINDLVRDDTIAPVGGEASQWIAPAFFIPKSDHQSLRFVVDYSGLNKYIVRHVHPFPTATDIINNIPNDSKWFMTLDALSGYFQILLSDEASRLTTFLIPQGRFRFKVAPMGLSASADEWNRRSDMALFQDGNIPGVMKIVDDILICGATLPELHNKAETVLKRLRKANIKIAKKKMKVGQSVPFAGFLVSHDGVRPDPERIASLQNLPPPDSLRQLRGYLGAIQQLQLFTPDLSNILRPLTDLTKKSAAYHWGEAQQAAFDRIKDLLYSELRVTYFDTTKKTIIVCDASKLFGVGHALCQQDAPGEKLRLIQCASRTLKPAENNYAITELEMLAIVYSFRKSDHFLRGCTNVEVWTDHRPLVGIFAKPMADCPNTRLLRMRLKLSSYTFKVVYVRGSDHWLADCLSRNPYFQPSEDDHTFCNAVTDEMDTSDDPQIRRLRDAATQDPEYQQLISAFHDGTDPSTLTADHPAWLLKKVWHDVSFQDGLLCINDCIIVPQHERRRILDLLHTGCPGKESMLRLARGRYFWTGMSNDVIQTCKACRPCIARLPSQRKEELEFRNAIAPLYEIGTDVFETNRIKYLIVVDRYSSFPWAYQLRGETAAQVIKKLLDMFHEHSYRPARIQSDEGSCFTSGEFAAFCKELDIIPTTSSPFFKQANGLAEAGVKRVKAVLEKSGGTYSKEAKNKIDEFRQCPMQAHGMSPAQMLYGFPTRSSLPTLPSFFKEVDRAEAKKNQAKTQDHQKKSWDKSARPLSLLRINQKVMVQSPTSKRWDREATVTSVRKDNHSYQVRYTDNGNLVTRNRIFLRPLADKNVHFSDPLKVIIIPRPRQIQT